MFRMQQGIPVRVVPVQAHAVQSFESENFHLRALRKKFQEQKLADISLEVSQELRSDETVQMRIVRQTFRKEKHFKGSHDESPRGKQFQNVFPMRGMQGDFPEHDPRHIPHGNSSSGFFRRKDRLQFRHAHSKQIIHMRILRKMFFVCQLFD